MFVALISQRKYRVSAVQDIWKCESRFQIIGGEVSSSQFNVTPSSVDLKKKMKHFISKI